MKRYEGNVRQLPSGKYQVRYRVEQQRLSGGTFDTRGDAERKLRTILGDLDRGTWIDDEKAKTLFRGFMARFMEHQATRVKPSTLRNNNSDLRVRLLPAFGTMEMRRIDAEAVDAWFDSVPATVARRNTYFLLSKAMKAAMRWGYIASNPCVVEDAGKNMAKPRPVFEMHDVERVLEHADDITSTVVLVALSGHLRIGEVCGLSRGDFNAATGRLRIERQLSLVGPKRLAETKTGNQRGLILLKPGWDALEAWIAAHPMLPSAPLFTGPKGGRIDRARINVGWNEAKQEAGYPDFHFHDLKRAGLTFFARATGATIKDLMKRGGHTSATTALMYQDSSDERDAELARLANLRLGTGR